MDITNRELQLANDFVKYTDNNIYLTGKAGTGKTTFLHKLKAISPKRMIITAPTGVAAINAGGVTLHSFFQMPFGPFVPDSDAQQQVQHRKFNKEKINIIKSLDLLVIDEISMVRADLLDGVDAALRRYKRHDQPFGGVQLLMIGDLHQLSPVVKDDEWALLKPYYETCYFFSSHALKQTQMTSIELKHIYRQSDAHFIELLNKVRDNRLDQQSLQQLNNRHIVNFQPDKKDNYITLTTHNRIADDINQQHLKNLKAKSFMFKAIVEGDYPSYNYPTADQLVLKKGAQVMFVRNDSSAEKMYFNGKIGEIVFIDQERIRVQCPGEATEITVEKTTWENIKYNLDAKTKAISEQTVGSFYQFPLRLAWAITIHKSQGLTFEHAIIDANAAFSHGQVYVALSRCKTFEGMVLSTPISQRAVKTDHTVAQFTQQVSQNLPTNEQLSLAKIAYQQKLLLQCFDHQALQNKLNKLITILRQNLQVIQFSGLENAEEISRQTSDDIIIVSEKFKRQLQSLFLDNVLPQDNTKLQERVNKAANYFLDKLESGVVEWINKFSFTSDNKETNKQIIKAINSLNHFLSIKIASLISCESGFSTHRYLNAIALAEIEFNTQKPVKKPKEDLSNIDVEHAELLSNLSAWRAKQAEQEEVERYRIIHQSVLIQIANILPMSKTDLLNIKGVGQHTVDKYAAALLDMVAAYCNKHNIQPEPVLIPEKTLQKTPKISSKQISYELYLEGKTIQQIADLRELVKGTIESHLTQYVGTGELNIDDFVSAEKMAKIQQALKNKQDESLSWLKEQLGDDISYTDIRMVVEHQKANVSHE